MDKKALVVLAEGFEDIEAISPVDILRRVGMDVIVAGLTGMEVTSSHDIKIGADMLLSDYKDMPDVIVLPGGMPGAENLANSIDLKDLIMKLFSQKKLIAAICAAPALVLAPLGVLGEKNATCFPGMEKVFPANVKQSKEPVIKDGNVITARGAGVAGLFSLKIVEALEGKAKADMLADQMCFE